MWKTWVVSWQKSLVMKNCQPSQRHCSVELFSDSSTRAAVGVHLIIYTLSALVKYTCNLFLLYSVFINYSLTWEWNKTRFCVHVVFLTGFCHCTYANHTIFCCQIYSVTFNERTVKVWTTPNCCLTVWCCDCYSHISINVSYWALIVMYKCSFKTLLWYISCNNRYFRTYFLLQYL